MLEESNLVQMVAFLEIIAFYFWSCFFGSSTRTNMESTKCDARNSKNAAAWPRYRDYLCL